MLLNPSVLSLLVVSGVVATITVAAALTSIGVLVRWRPEDAGERQLAREHRLLLVETALGVALGLQLVSVFAFVWVADRLHPLLPGAMCAAGSLQANPFGYPGLAVKTAAFLVAGLWWLVHRESPHALSVGLVRVKHLALIVVAVALVADNVVQLRYFGELTPDVLASCCSSTFREGTTGVGSRLASISPQASQMTLFGTLGITLVLGTFSGGRGRWSGHYAAWASIAGLAGAVAVVSWVAPAFYEAPTHHCPFCLLSSEEHYVGYLLFSALALGLLSGIGCGLVGALRRLDPVGALRAGAERRLCRVSLLSYLLFTAVAVWPIVSSDLRPGSF